MSETKAHFRRARQGPYLRKKHGTARGVSSEERIQSGVVAYEAFSSRRLWRRAWLSPLNGLPLRNEVLASLTKVMDADMKRLNQQSFHVPKKVWAAALKDLGCQ
jgi:hypothetical protein